uniref:Uncharacterized protein n=1 Tax=Rangifer tarandus platyrhynchus TaxID=3082113 RepID=A0ACB0FMV2_RANTA|nr:unnamed protein product [Rangifer tarandus platyrhynchus]
MVQVPPQSSKRDPSGPMPDKQQILKTCLSDECGEAVSNLPASWQDSSRQPLSRGKRGAVGTQAAAGPPPPSPPPGAKSAVLAAAGAAAAGGAEALHHCSGLAGGAPLPRSRPDGHLPAAARSQRRDSTRPLIGAEREARTSRAARRLTASASVPPGTGKTDAGGCVRPLGSAEPCPGRYPPGAPNSPAPHLGEDRHPPLRPWTRERRHLGCKQSRNLGAR